MGRARMFILWLPFVIRLLILAKPMRQVINKLLRTLAGSSNNCVRFPSKAWASWCSTRFSPF